jgi:Mg2+/Co2+ transporter CorC
MVKDMPGVAGFDEDVESIEDMKKEAVEAGEDELDETEDGEAVPASDAKAKAKAAMELDDMKELTTENFKILKAQTEALSLRALRRLLKLFRTACHLGDEGKVGDEGKREETKIANSK